MASLEIAFQPKQGELLEELEHGEATWIGAGGGRGAAKSSAIDRSALTLMYDYPGMVGAIVMRTSQQVRKYHVEPLLRTFPDLEQYYHSTKGKLKLPVGDGKYSELDIGYAENYAAVENFFRSGNYRFVFVDQAEQFTEKELREIKKACRCPDGPAKMVLSHNMGGVGIQALRKWFHTKEYGSRERPENFKFYKFNPWDNVFWVLDALREDGLTEVDYYSWTDKQRMEYAAERGEYTRLLSEDDDALRERDWFGSWESIEGAYFARVLDANNTIQSPSIIAQLMQPWWKRWMSGDWGSGHYTSYYWHARGEVTPVDAKRLLGLDVEKSISVMVTYREWLGQGLSEREIGEQLIKLSTDEERGKAKYSSEYGMAERVRNFYYSPDAFELSIRRSGQNMIADELGKVTAAGGLPRPTKANNARKPGWRAMYGLLKNTKEAFADEYKDVIWLIGDNCPELIKALPMALRDPKDLEDVLKTDKESIDITQDALDGCRYGVLCREVNDNEKPKEAVLAEKLAGIKSNTAKHMAHMQFEAQWKNKKRSFKLK